MTNACERKRIKLDSKSETTIATNNTAQVPACVDFKTANSFVCGVCDNAMHFQKFKQRYDIIRCSICNQKCGTIQLSCDNCGLFICCNERNGYRVEWKSSCYNSYFDATESVRKTVYNRQILVSEFNAGDQQRWLQCMWHDIARNMKRFRTELQHASQTEKITNTQGAKQVIQNIGYEMSKSIVRWFIVFHAKFDVEVVKWFSSLMQHKQETFRSVAFETAMSLRGRFEQVKWLMHKLDLEASSYEIFRVVKVAVKRGRVKVLEYLLENVTMDPSAGDNYAIREASRCGHVDVVERLLQDGRVDQSSCENCAVRWASQHGHLNVVKRLIQDDRVDPSVAENFVIQTASHKGCLDIVERLLQDERVDPSANDNHAIRSASENGYLIL